MKSRNLLIVIIISAVVVLVVSIVVMKKLNYRHNLSQYTGSESCKPCHERFYDLWSSSHHGLAMQPVTGDFIEKNIYSSGQTIKVGTSEFSVEVSNDSLVFTETLLSGSSKRYTAHHTMGGKYIYYFLTPLDRGRLQVIPLAYDCLTDEWYNNPESGVRHFETMEDSPLEWTSHLYTFNTTCYNCHVSQLETNFDLDNNEYNTSWREPGINCETCHGPSREHIEVCVKAGEGNIPEDLKIVLTSAFSQEQHNGACGSCHGKSAVIARDFKPGGLFYDYFDLTTLENPDFYADGRDLGENYTMTTWSMNKCVENSDMHCATCHTSSGRYRFSGDNANDACMPCHEDKVQDISSHSYHLADGDAGECISCHMPKTTFARMDRSDHSFRPPMPEATMAFGSPNACNLCHDDKSPQWANESIRNTHAKDYQSETVANGFLIRKAREADWSDLDEILTGLNEGSFNEVFATSFIRLLENCFDEKKWPVMIKMTESESPLVRSAAAHSLAQFIDTDALKRLIELTNDKYRLVRLNAAYALSSYPPQYLAGRDSSRIALALGEYEGSLITRPDDWSAYYNLGNYYSNTGQYEKALDAYNTSVKVYPEAIMPMVNSGFIYSLSGNYEEAEKKFQAALSYVPDHEAALLNLALLYGETGKTDNAKQYFKRLIEVSDNNAVAAYNLAVLVSTENIDEAVELSGKAAMWDSENTRYSYTHAYFTDMSGNSKEAIKILNDLINDQADFLDAYFLLSSIHIRLEEKEKARKILNRALENEGFSDEQKQALLSQIKQIE